MKTYIVLVRGINVGGKHSLPMKELVAILEELGAQNVRTYIQSGNVLLDSAEIDTGKLCKAIGSAIKNSRGFEPHILLLTLAEMEKVVAKNPYPEAARDHKTLHAGFLDCEPPKPDLKKLEGLQTETERFHLSGKVFYLHTPDGLGRSKLAAGAEKALGVPATFRNWRTVCKLLEVAGDTT